MSGKPMSFITEPIENSSSFTKVILPNRGLREDILNEEKCVIKLHGDINELVTYETADKIFSTKEYAVSIEKNATILGMAGTSDQKSRFEFMGIEYTEKDLYAHVLAMEQIMSTGGGWQDQVGGITPGLKYITSMPGIDQQLKVTHVDIPEFAKRELDDRFVLIYTGQRRLARNLLRDVVGRYVGNEPDSLFALEEIQKTAALMCFELERGNVDGFAKLLDYHWELSRKVDAGSSNTLIEQIFSSIEELIDGKLVCGAGGGGFLQVILKKGVTKQQVENRLNEVFMDSLVGVADCKLVWE